MADRPQEYVMNEHTFRRYMQAAKLMDDDYGTGYQRGLRRHYHGDRFGTEQEHSQWMSLGREGDPRTQLGTGYRDGVAGRAPTSDDLTINCRTRCGMDVTEVATSSGIPRRTLHDWWRTRRRAVDLIIMGLMYERSQEEFTPKD